MLYVYLLGSAKDKKQYIGSTINLRRRLRQHNSGQVRSTKHRRPFDLIGFQQCDTIEKAALFEKKYKRSHDDLKRMIKSGRFKRIGV